MSLSKNNSGKKFASMFLPAKGENIWTNLPLLALLVSNAVPLFGVLYLKWDVFYIVLLYWAENLVIGFYNILKIALVRVGHPIEHLGKLFMIPFFIIHYGGFAAGHGFFILAIFSKDKQVDSILDGETWPCFLVFVQMLINVINHIIQIIPSEVKLAVLSLFASHGVSFVYNYLIKGEYTKASLKELMHKPYSRVFIMHITVLVGAFVMMALKSPAGVLVVLVILKTIIDVKLHFREHIRDKETKS